MLDENRCPACGGEIDPEDIEVDDNFEETPDCRIVYYTCFHCGRLLKAYFDDGLNFSHFEIA